MGYNRSYQGYGGGVGATLEYELSFKDSSRLEISCDCTLFRGKDYVETRNYVNSPYLESLGNQDFVIEYSTPRTNMFQHRFKLGYETSGYETADSNNFKTLFSVSIVALIPMGKVAFFSSCPKGKPPITGMPKSPKRSLKTSLRLVENS